MTASIHKQAKCLFQPGRTGRASVCLYNPVTGVGLVSPAFGIRRSLLLDSNETGMT